jgi:sugar/nucleoside kinase (ribokinase family)
LGATVVASLVAGLPLEEGLRRGTRFAARNVTHRGASGLRDHLLGKLTTA